MKEGISIFVLKQTLSLSIAEEIFRKADQIKPGSFQTLDAKALRLVG